MGVKVTEVGGPIVPGFVYGFHVTGMEWRQEVTDMWHWCYGRFDDYGPHGSWYVDGPIVWMKDPTEAMEFKLRWM